MQRLETPYSCLYETLNTNVVLPGLVYKLLLLVFDALF